MIQVIRYDNYLNCAKFDKPYLTKTFDRFNSFDEFDICVIDLSNPSLWCNNAGTKTGTNSDSNLVHFKKIIGTSTRAKILIVLPQNLSYSYGKSIYGGYNSAINLKNSFDTIYNLINNNLIDFSAIKLSFEPTNYIIKDKNYNADFYFSSLPDTCEKVTDTPSGNKTTTIKLSSNIAITTLNATSEQEFLTDLLIKIDFIKENVSEIPDWVKTFNCLNDEHLISQKENCISNIKILEEQISKIDSQLADNLNYKKLLYEYGDELVEQVMRILDKILDNDSSDFVDNYEEDFLIKKDTITFVGEIKGVSSNVNNDLIAASERHLQEYNDKLETTNTVEKTKGIFIVNHQRQKDLSVRIPIDDKQIKLAEKYGILIIETTTLLKIFEDFSSEKIKIDECIDLLSSSIGLLSYSKKE